MFLYLINMSKKEFVVYNGKQIEIKSSGNLNLKNLGISDIEDIEGLQQISSLKKL